MDAGNYIQIVKIFAQKSQFYWCSKDYNFKEVLVLLCVGFCTATDYQHERCTQ